MQLVMFYSVGDGCTYSCDITLPIIYDSPLAASLDFLKVVETAYSSGAKYGEFEWCGHKFNTSDFYTSPMQYGFNEAPQYSAPEFYTIDEWFKLYNL